MLVYTLQLSSSLAVFTAALSAAAAEAVRLFISSVRSPNLVSSEVPIDHQYIYVYYAYVCVCVYVILNVFNIYTYAFKVCVCVCRVCIHPRLRILVAIVIYIIFMIFTHTHTHTPSLAYKIYYVVRYFSRRLFYSTRNDRIHQYTLLCWTNKIELPLDER